MTSPRDRILGYVVHKTALGSWRPITQKLQPTLLDTLKVHGEEGMLLETTHEQFECFVDAEFAGTMGTSVRQLHMTGTSPTNYYVVVHGESDYVTKRSSKIQTRNQD